MPAIVIPILMILPLIAIVLFVAAKPEGWMEFNENFMRALPGPKELRQMPKLSAKDVRYVSLVGAAVLTCAEIIFLVMALSEWYNQPL